MVNERVLMTSDQQILFYRRISNQNIKSLGYVTNGQGYIVEFALVKFFHDQNGPDYLEN